jgi:hypothetical protein
MRESERCTAGSWWTVHRRSLDRFPCRGRCRLGILTAIATLSDRAVPAHGNWIAQLAMEPIFILQNGWLLQTSDSNAGALEYSLVDIDS